MFWFSGTLPVRFSLSVSADEASEQYRQQADSQRAAGEHGGWSAATETEVSEREERIQDTNTKNTWTSRWSVSAGGESRQLVANMLASATRWSEDEMIFFNTETPTEKQPKAQSTSANQQPVSSWAVRLKYGDELVEPETRNKFRWIRMSSPFTHRETDTDYRRRKQAGFKVFKVFVVFSKKNAAENSEHLTDTSWLIDSNWNHIIRFISTGLNMSREPQRHTVMFAQS